jgi:hypothetical protein
VFLGSVGEFGSDAGAAVEAGHEATIRAHRRGVGAAGAPAAFHQAQAALGPMRRTAMRRLPSPGSLCTSSQGSHRQRMSVLPNRVEVTLPGSHLYRGPARRLRFGRRYSLPGLDRFSIGVMDRADADGSARPVQAERAHALGRSGARAAGGAGREVTALGPASPVVEADQARHRGGPRVGGGTWGFMRRMQGWFACFEPSVATPTSGTRPHPPLPRQATRQAMSITIYRWSIR